MPSALNLDLIIETINILMFNTQLLLLIETINHVGHLCLSHFTSSIFSLKCLPQTVLCDRSD